MEGSAEKSKNKYRSIPALLDEQLTFATYHFHENNRSPTETQIH